MFKFLTLVAALLGLTAAATDADWAVFKARHGKTYYSQEEDYLRRTIYEDNLKTIQEHNQLFAKGLKSFSLGENQFLDMTNAEFIKVMNGYRPNGVDRPRDGQTFKLQNGSLPAEVDWVKKGYVTAVKNQGQCGSCWSFSTTGSLEGAHFKATGKLVSLSEKNLMDCSKKYGPESCQGGWMDDAFKYIIANKGIDTEKSYPYEPRDSSVCKFNRKNVGATMSSYVDIPTGSEEQLQQAVATIGPVSVAIDASRPGFTFYHSGVYDDPACKTSVAYLDHAVLVVGYGTENGKDYWLVKNSWGENWGSNGYIKMGRNKGNQCGIATRASYPVV